MNAATATGPSLPRPRGPLSASGHHTASALPVQPRQLAPLVLAQLPVPGAAPAPVQVHPVAQGALVDSELPGDLRDRLAGLPDQPYRALPEVLIELPSCLCHRRPPLGDVSTVRGETHRPQGVQLEIGRA